MASNPSYGLRHEAGLNAGRILPLPNGRYAFGPKSSDTAGGTRTHPDVVTFELEVSGTGVLLTPGSVPVTVDGRPVNKRSRIQPGQMIEAGADRFVLEPHGRSLIPPAAPRRLVAPRLDDVPAKKALRLRRSNKLAEEVAKRRKRQLARFSEEIEQTVRSEAMGRRSGTGSPIDVRRAADRGAPHSLAARGTFAIGFTSEPMSSSPKVDGEISDDTERVVRRYRQVSSVPYLIDFNHHRLGVVGPREAALAVSRHLLTANATSTTPMAVNLHVDPSSLPEWSIVEALRPLATPSQPLAVIDQAMADVDPPSALAVAPSQAELPLTCSAILEIDDEGYATITLGNDQPVALIPIGISVEQAAEIGELLAAHHPRNAATLPVKLEMAEPAAIASPTTRPVSAPAKSPAASSQSVATPSPDSDDLTTGAVLVTGTNPETTTEVLSSLTVDLLLRSKNQVLTVHIIDAGSRSLIRLRQLAQTKSYAPIDDLAAVERLLIDLQATLDEPAKRPAVLIANQVGHLLAFLERVGRSDLRDKLSSLVGFHDRVRLLVAASGPAEADVPTAILPTFAVRLRCDDEQNGRLENGRDDERTISISGLSGHDLTRSVASLLVA